MNSKYSKMRAFTLVELLIVIAIIALLTGIVVSNLTSSRSRARDAKRISDLGHIQLALELYFDRCKQYPLPVLNGSDDIYGEVSVDADNGCPSGVTLGSFISKIPTPPISSDPSALGFYEYNVNDVALPRDYFLHVTLENSSEIIKDSAIPPAGFPVVFYCDDAPGTKEYCLGSK